MTTVPRKTLRLHQGPVVAEMPINEIGWEILPRYWNVKISDIDSVDSFYSNCRRLTDEMHGPGSLDMALEESRHSKQAFYWTSMKGDIILIFATHAKGKINLSKDDLKKFANSLTERFLKKLVLAILKSRKVGYQFLHIKRSDEYFNFALSPVVEANLWELLFDGEIQPIKHSQHDRVKLEVDDILVIRQTMSLSIKELHQYRIPLDQISESMKNVILRNSSFARIVPHGHKYQVDGEIFHHRLATETHPNERKISREYKGSAKLINCSECGGKMLGFSGDLKCARCASLLNKDHPKREMYGELFDSHYRVTRPAKKV